MTRPRFSISGLMAVVVLVALDFGLGRALAYPPFFSPRRTDLILLGAFPMGNVLAVALARLHATRRDPTPGRPDLLAFARAGLAAWLAFLAALLLAPEATNAVVLWLIEPSGLRPGLGLATLGLLACTLPQLAFAAWGVRLGRRYAVRWSLTIERIGGGPVIDWGAAPLRAEAPGQGG